MADDVMSKEEFNRLLREEPLPAPYNSAMGRSAAWVDTWPPIWKSLEEVSHYVSLQPFLELEESIKDDPRQKKLVRILKRVRKTRGYGLNCHHEKIMGYPLSWRPLRPHLCGMVRRRLGLVIAKMNALAQSHGYVGYVYEFSELENVVSHPIRKCILLSFSVKEFYCGQFVEFKDVRANVFFGGGEHNCVLVDLSWRKICY